MARFPSGPFGQAAGQPLDYRAGVDEVTVGQFFNTVFAWMAVGLAVTAGVAYWVFMNSGGAFPLTMGSFLVLFVVELILVGVVSSAINRINATVATALFVLYAALNGVTLSVIFYAYAKSSIASTFLVTAGAFGAMSLYGYVTKRDLTRLGSLLFMGLIGVILASVVNIFWHNPMLYWIVSYAGVLVFVGLTAYDTQKLKAIAMQTGGDPALAHRLAIVGSLSLYLDFINLFLFLLRIMGNRKQ
jgi:FtsH-binding integral membrane protein